MDSEHLSQLVDRYFRGETSTEEEALLRRALADRAEGSADTNGAAPLTPEERAAAAMLRLAGSGRGDTVRIRLHQAPQRRWRIAAATALSAAAIAAVAITLTRPTVYGYVNGQPVTSIAEARDCSRQMFSDMRADHADRTAPLRDILDIE